MSVDPGDPALEAMNPRQRRAGIYDGLRALLLQESLRRPLILVVEDLHWVDEQSEAALQMLIDAVAATRVMLVLTFRPGYEHSLGQRSYFNRLFLADLTAEQSVQLAQSMLAQSALPPALSTLIASKGEGNPFYVEEVTRSLLEKGVLRAENGGYRLAQPIESIRVPDTIQEIILSRIDRLAAEAKSALQLAAVIGREFTVRLLKRITDLEASLDEVLGELKSLELIYQEAYFPELSYMFKHALTQDVAYRTLLRQRRRTLHRLIGQAIEELYAGRLAEQVEMLAHHYYEGADWERALIFLVQAGHKAAAAFANQDALDYYERALELCQRIGDSTLSTAAETARRRAGVNRNIGQFKAAVVDYDRMRQAAIALGDRRLEGMALTLRGETEMWDHDFATAEETLNSSLALADEGYDDIRFFASAVFGRMLKACNRQREANACYETARELAPDVDDPVMTRFWRLAEPMWPHWEGDYSQALQIHRRNQHAMEEANIIDLGSRWFQALSLGGAGRYQEAHDLLHQIHAAGQRLGDVAVTVRVLNSLGWLYGELGNHQEAMQWNQQGVTVAVEAGLPIPEVESNARINLGDSLMALGRLDEAEAQYEIVEQIARDPRPQDVWALWRYSQHLFHSYGQLCLARGELERARDYAAECLALAEESHSQKNLVKGHRLWGEIALAEGDWDTAASQLSLALEIAQRVGNPAQLWQTYAASGKLYAAQDRLSDARSAFLEAAAVIQGVAAGLSDPALRQAFLAGEKIREILARSGAAAGTSS